jgi:hypothetical protein
MASAPRYRALLVPVAHMVRLLRVSLRSTVVLPHREAAPSIGANEDPRPPATVADAQPVAYCDRVIDAATLQAFRIEIAPAASVQIKEAEAALGISFRDTATSGGIGRQPRWRRRGHINVDGPFCAARVMIVSVTPGRRSRVSNLPSSTLP